VLIAAFNIKNISLRSIKGGDLSLAHTLDCLLSAISEAEISTISDGDILFVFRSCVSHFLSIVVLSRPTISLLRITLGNTEWEAHLCSGTCIIGTNGISFRPIRIASYQGTLAGSRNNWFPPFPTSLPFYSHGYCRRLFRRSAVRRSRGNARKHGVCALRGTAGIRRGHLCRDCAHPNGDAILADVRIEEQNQTLQHNSLYNYSYFWPRFTVRLPRSSGIPAH
jgi:hypothetical protein